MKEKLFTILIVLALLSGLVVDLALAEDGELFRRNISKTPDLVTEKAAIYMMDFYVPAQDSTGLVGPIDNYILDDGVSGFNEDGERGYEAREYAKPLVSVYIDGPEGLFHEETLLTKVADFLGLEQDNGIEAVTGGIIFGEMDAFVGVSMDDGTSWRTENLSRSADLSSFTLDNGHAFPGHVHQLVHQVAEDKIFVAWVSKYCDGGSPLYTFSSDSNLATYAPYLADLEDTYFDKDAMYLYDLFGVAGPQASVDYVEQGYPDVGEIPYSCVWSARGKVVPGDDPMTEEALEASHVLWAKPERLTSGVRDANLPAVDCAKGAGCVLTWQEDPKGLRPGDGEGPGTGWSGAIANAKTDIWYSYISYADFDLVFPEGTDYTLLPADGPVTMEANELAGGTTLAKPYVPMAMPVRLTDNDMCRYTTGTSGSPEDPFCWIDFDSIDDLDNTNITAFLDGLTGPEEGADFCAEAVAWTNPGGTTLDLCKTENGRAMVGRVGATRVRMALKAYTPADAVDRDGDGIVENSAWLSMATEETKAMGDLLIDAYGNPTEDPLDIGKDIWYFSFDMFDHPFVDQGGMLNQPAKCSPWTVGADYDCTDYEFFPIQVDPLNEGEFYLTEIARRFALTLNNIPNIVTPEDGGSGISGMLIYKQGIIWQGGPADIMLRRVVVPVGFDPTVDNPYAFENMECAEWAYTDGSNPNYLKGMCLSPAINISGTTIVRCDAGTGNDACAATFPVADDGTIPEELQNTFPKVYEWRNCDGGGTIEGCEDDNDIDDQSWENPFDVAKGHRGFLDGDHVMMMYAWASNWQSNAVGNDHYNLYVRRSFDGGLTWTTTPAALGGAGVDALDYYYNETPGDFIPIVWSYGAGEFEQARNVSLLHGNKITILDPRYSPAGGLKQYPTIRTDWLTTNADLLPAITSDDTLPYEDDLVRDSSKYMLIYETGDNSTVEDGEAVPLNLYYSRGTMYGDFYEWYDYVSDELDGNPDPITGEITMTVDIEPRFPWLENNEDDLSGEASVVLNPGGTFSYQVWNQWQEEILADGHEYIHDSDIIFRRLMYLPDDAVTATDFAPISSILYSSHTLEVDYSMTLVLAGTARDLDRLGDGDPIVEYEWLVSLNGGAWTKIGSDKVLSIAVSNLQPGWAQFKFKAKDNDGRWSPGADFNIAVYESIPSVKLYLPVLVQKP